MSTEDPVSAPDDSADPWYLLRATLTRELSAQLDSLGASSEEGWLSSQLESPAQPPADLAVALHRPARALGRPPPELATELAGRLTGLAGFARVEARGAYLNFEVDAAALASASLGLVFSLGSRYGHGAPRGTPTSVEHTSANTTGPLHIGRVRNAVIGDTFVRTLRAAGHPVVSQYYVDDVGRQAAIITWIWSKPFAQWPPEIASQLPEGADRPAPGQKEDEFLGRAYPATSAYLKQHKEAAEEVQRIARDLEAGHEPPGHHELAERILGGMRASLKRIGVTFDEFVWESSLIHDGSIVGVVERLGKAPHALREENCALAIDTGSYGLPKEDARVIVTRGDGTSLYVTRDVAFHLGKFARFPRVVDVLGVDHLLHARTLEALLTEISEPRRPEFILYAYITAPGGGKMSTRGGSAVYLDDLLNEAVTRARQEVLARREDLNPEEVDRVAESVAAGAIRYSIVRVAPEKTVQFRWEDALSFEGRSGPFLQYSYARASSLLRKAEHERGPFPFRVEELGTPLETALIKSLSRLPSTVSYVARSAHVHSLATYAHDLAEAFNRFYNELPVLRAERERESRVALVAASRQVLGNTLELLGVPRLETM
jgi:arginyl-tRNA synthetase